MRNLGICTLSVGLLGAFFAGSTARVCAEPTSQYAAIQGLLPFSLLLNSAAGRTALQRNYEITAAIQTGNAKQPGLQPFAAQQARALKDAFITSGNAFQLADGLGSGLGGAYQAKTSYIRLADGKTTTFTNLSPALADLFTSTSAVTGADSGSAKFFFGSGLSSVKSGSIAASPAALTLLHDAGGTIDVFGKAYGHPRDSPGADLYGDSRPFQTETRRLTYAGTDFFGTAASNHDYLFGPAQDARQSPAFPSGHTTYGYSEALLLAILVPKRYPQMMARAAEYGNSRVMLGAHYVMDVIAGRTLAAFEVAHLLATDGKTLPAPLASHIKSYRHTLELARIDLKAGLRKSCGESVTCNDNDTSRFRNAATNEAFYESTQTYGLPVVYPTMAGRVEDVSKIAPEAGYLLTSAFPTLSLPAADRILTVTEGPGGGFLDNGSAFGVYSRLDLYRAAQQAAKSYKSS